MQITTMEKNGRGAHQKITNSFSTGALYPRLPLAHEAYIRSLSKQRHALTFQKYKTLFGLAIISRHCAS
jgi:hypothetical protein